MPKTKGQQAIYVTIGVLLMATAMSAYNKFYILREFSPAFFRATLIGFLQRAPIAWPLQYFLVQPIAGKMAGRPQVISALEYKVTRIGWTVLITCPVMSLYSNVLLLIEKDWTLMQMLNNWLPSMCRNWIFAFFIQLFALNWLNAALFKLVCRQKAEKT